MTNVSPKGKKKEDFIKGSSDSNDGIDIDNLSSATKGQAACNFASSLMNFHHLESHS